VARDRANSAAWSLLQNVAKTIIRITEMQRILLTGWSFLAPSRSLSRHLGASLEKGAVPLTRSAFSSFSRVQPGWVGDSCFRGARIQFFFSSTRSGHNSPLATCCTIGLPLMSSWLYVSERGYFQAQARLHRNLLRERGRCFGGGTQEFWRFSEHAVRINSAEFFPVWQREGSSPCAL
jgi:hypothetical protein